MPIPANTKSKAEIYVVMNHYRDAYLSIPSVGVHRIVRIIRELDEVQPISGDHDNPEDAWHEVAEALAAKAEATRIANEQGY